MRVSFRSHPHSEPVVRAQPHRREHRVGMTIGGLEFHLTETQARRLADELHDALDEALALGRHTREW